jgi:uncharacterized membrane protein YgcG
MEKRSAQKKLKIIGIASTTLFTVSMIVFAPLIFGAIVMLIWNRVLVDLGAPAIEYLQAIGIYILSGILFRKTGRLADFLLGRLRKVEGDVDRKQFYYGAEEPPREKGEDSSIYGNKIKEAQDGFKRGFQGRGGSQGNGGTGSAQCS